jgi:hypothetical protein
MKIMTPIGAIPCTLVDPASDLFKCRVCGTECAIAPQLPERAVCPEHCEDHQYKYERGDGHRCIHCFAEPPSDWFDE